MGGMSDRRVVLFPLPMKGRMNPMLQLGSMLHSKGLSVSIICTELNSPDPADHPMFTFHIISHGLSAAESSSLKGPSFFAAINKGCEKSFMECLSRLVAEGGSPSSTFLIVDAFLHFARAVAHSLNMCAIILLPFKVSCFRMFLNYKDTHSQFSIPGENMETVIPEFSPLRWKDAPKMNLQNPTQVDELMSSINREIRKSDGMVFNSFVELESDDVAKLEEELNIPIFPCGPLQMVGAVSGSPQEDNNNKCISWLDQQLPGSVLYISLGTVVSLTEPEFLELARGIAMSNRPFLWVVRKGLVLDSSSSEPTMEQGLSKGLVVEWAPQKEVLAHPAVGGFLTHAGWNSVMESISAGVPMICAPFLAEQFANARYVSEAWKIGIYFEEKIHSSNIQKVIRMLMEPHKESNEMRENIAFWKNKVQQTLQVGGSSYKSLENLVQYINN